MSKKWIETSTGDLLCVENGINLAYEGQFTIMRQKYARERVVADANLGSMSSACAGKISLTRLQGVPKQYKVRNMVTTCHGLTKSTMGYPYAPDFLARGMRALCKDEFSQHWWLHIPVEPNTYPAAISMEISLARYQINIFEQLVYIMLDLIIIRYHEAYVNEPSAARKHL